MTGALAVVSLLTLAGCSGSSTSPAPSAPASAPSAPASVPAGETPRQLVIGFVPSQDASRIPAIVKPMEDYLTRALGIPVRSFTGTNYAAVIEGMGSKQVDIGFLNTLSYVLAHDQYGVDVLLQTVRNGSDHYRSQIISLKDKGFKSLSYLKGKRFGFVDPASASGYLYPALMFKNAGIDPQKDLTASFLTSHDVVARAVYNGDVDAGACFDDCRDNIVKTNPDVKDKVAVIAYSDDIPNDTVSVRPGIDPAFTRKFVDALMAFVQTPEGKETVKQLYSIDGFAPSSDARFNIVRDVARKMDINLQAEASKNK